MKDNGILNLNQHHDNITITEAHSSVHNKPFTMVPNELIQKANLSDKATFLIIYLISFPVGWKFHDWVIMKRLKCAEDKLKSLFKELRDTGYLKTIPISAGGGKFSGSKRIFADTPIFLNEKTCKNQDLTESGFLPTVGVLPTLGKNPPSYINTNSVINNNIKTTTIRTPRSVTFTNSDPVVVSFFERLNKLATEPAHRVSMKFLIEASGRHDNSYLDEKVVLVEKSAPRNPGALFRAAVNNNYNLPNQKTSNSTISKKKTYTRMENIKYWSSLNEIRKNELYKSACTAWPMLPYMMKQQKLSTEDSNFLESSLFETVMEINGRPEK